MNATRPTITLKEQLHEKDLCPLDGEYSTDYAIYESYAHL